jgi:Peptidase M16 inactive domain
MENTLPEIYLARPNLREPDSYVLEVIGALLSQGKSSRLYQGLVTDLERGRDTGIAAHTHARRGDALLPGLLSSQQRHLGGRGGYHRRGGPGQAASPTRRLAHGRHPHDDVRLRLRARAADDHHRPADRAGQHRPRSRGHQPGEPRLLCAQRDELPPRRGRFASRLVEEIRDKRGLPYSVASFFEAGKHPGAFQIVLQTKNAQAQEAISLAVQQMERMRTEPVPENELEAAKRALIGSFPLRLGSQAQLAPFLTQVEYYGLGLDYPATYSSRIASVRREDVLCVAQAYLHPQHRILVMVANLQEAGVQ